MQTVLKLSIQSPTYRKKDTMSQGKYHKLRRFTPHPLCQLAMTCSCNEGEESIQDHRQTVNALRHRGTVIKSKKAQRKPC